MTLTLVRHAQPLVAPGVCYGALDMPADAAATRQAALALAQNLPTGLKVTTSPLQRCELLTHILKGLRPDLAYKTDQNLAEMNFGSFEGQRWDSIPPAAFDAWTADFWQHRFGGAESVAEVMARVAGVWDEAVVSAQPQVWITHAGVIRAATLLAQGVRRIHQATDWPQAAPAFGQWLVLPWEGSTRSV
ncbi:histidine phosphatase family protein [Rhodoferax sp. 4810]|nr:histidine phosphatase family protein [Rhodoferax jenense]